MTNKNPIHDEANISIEDIIQDYAFTIIYFYPKDDTPGCTLEANDFNAILSQLPKNCQVIGVSKDSDKSHCKFIDKYQLNFKLISDPEFKLHKQFACVGEKSMYGRKYIGTIRSTFLLQNNGVVIHERRNISVNGHAKKVLEKLQEVVMGNVS